MNYLFEIVETLYEINVNQNVDLNGKRMVSALTVLCCFHRVVLKMESIPFELVVALLSMLKPMPDTKSLQCADWDHVNALLPETMKKTACDAIHRSIVHLCQYKHLSSPEWLFALPVFHFLNGTSKPFLPIERNPRAIPWGDRVIGLGLVRNLIRDKEFGYVNYL